MSGSKHVEHKAQNAGLQALALSFVLPHENKPMRLPVVPAALTAVMSGMAESTIKVTEDSGKRAFLCRDPCYPLWLEKSCTRLAVGIRADLLSIPSGAGNYTLPTPSFNGITPFWQGIPEIDGKAVGDYGIVNSCAVIGRGVSNPTFYIPPGSTFFLTLESPATASGGGFEAEIVSYKGEDEFRCTLLLMPTIGGKYEFDGNAGTTSAIEGQVLEGTIPVGFCELVSFRVAAGTIVSALTDPILHLGWATGGFHLLPSGTIQAMLPYAYPVEFTNSRLPYARTRLNASAALFTNVTAALAKEGTILAARLKQSSIDPWNFGTTDIDAVHPALRYFGPLEKGLYTFTTPSGNLDNFDDFVYPMPNTTVMGGKYAERPLFDFKSIGVYNAMVFSDVDNSSASMLAVSQYVHLEFETTSSLFNLGVSTQTLEALHATEVALLKFGHFHENPLHWAALKAAATAAMRFVGPMVAPVIQHYGTKLVDRGVAYLRGKPQGDRRMQQATLQPPRKARPPARRTPKRAHTKKR